MEKYELDVHTHTIASGHAYSTISELVAEAKNKELKLLGIVEHDVGIPGTCDPIYFKNYHVVPRNFNGLDLILGIEINILDHDGKLSIDENLYQYVDYCMAGIHFHCYQPGTIEQNTHAVIETIKNPHISVIVHPDDGYCPLDYEKVVLAAKNYHTLLEVNNNALRSNSRLHSRENVIEMLRLCHRCQVPVIFGSDAHIHFDVMNFDQIESIITEINFPKKLIVNYDVDKFYQFIK
ncbi:phosphatase [uncultured Thomasclavelia sp.]|uniref:phosphatase n=1 Tax=uncultured Thomasclavelia sp. TaxID=3025759 RepID=UPI0025DAF131|nr:phosphatase [uncultured Thomasclavelia sp.]